MSFDKVLAFLNWPAWILGGAIIYAFWANCCEVSLVEIALAYGDWRILMALASVLSLVAVKRNVALPNAA